MQNVKEWQEQEQMFSFFNPWIIIGVICAILGVYSYGHHNGYQERVSEDQTEIERLNTEARAKETQLNKQKKATSVALRKANDVIQSKQAVINSRIDAGELRLPSNCGVSTDTDARASRGAGGGSQSESDRQAIKDIVAIAAEGDRAIEERNACINFYNTVRSKVNEVGK